MVKVRNILSKLYYSNRDEKSWDIAKDSIEECIREEVREALIKELNSMRNKFPSLNNLYVDSIIDKHIDRLS